MSLIGQVFSRLFRATIHQGPPAKMTDEALLALLIEDHKSKTKEVLDPKSVTDVMKAMGIPDSATSLKARENAAMVYEDDYPELEYYTGTEEENSVLIKALLDDYVKHHI